MKFLLFILCLFIAQPVFAAEQTKEPVFDRVMRTQTIRCGYAVASPFFVKDPVSGKYSGIWYEYVEEMGKQLGLKIDWVAEIGLGEIAEALNSQRIDAFCNGLWVSSERIKVEDFVTPISYQIVNAYVRADDIRFDGNLERINDPAIKVSCIDGEMAVSIAQTDFPKAKTACLPQSAPLSDLMLNVALRKADVTFASPAFVAGFNKTNKPGLKKVKLSAPIRVFPESVAVAQGEDRLRRMLDLTTEFLINTGKTDQIIKKYLPSKEDVVLPKKPYEDQ